jgi:hypothetical protein
MLLGTGNRFSWWASNQTAPPAAGALAGTTVTSNASLNVVGTTVTIMSALAEDAYGVLIQFNGNVTSGSNRSALCNIFVDPAGGTSWTTLIPTLMADKAGFLSSGTAGVINGGVWYWFPLFIKAGSTLGANHQNAQPSQSLGIWVTVFGKPSNPASVRTGSYVRAFGADTANSRGTVVVKGVSAAEGASWTQIGSNTADSLWWWQFGLGCADSTLSQPCIFFDVAAGDGSNKDLILENLPWTGTGQEAAFSPLQMVNNYRETPSGVGIYGRASIASATALDADNPNMMAYGVGG